MRVYLVGGAVRDRLLDLPVHERDWVVTGATPADMRAQGFVPVDGTFPVFRLPRTGDEYALARVETKSGSGHRGFSFDCGPQVTLEQDLARRDLTINAIAEDSHGTPIDPFDGLGSLRERRLVHVTPAFADDPLRLLRAARFAACLAHLGFSIDESTLALMRAMAQSGEAASLSAARVWREIDRALCSPTPRVIFDVLRDCGAAAALLPSQLCLSLQRDGRALHLLQTVASTTDDPDTRLAALIVAALASSDVADAGAIARAMNAPAQSIRTVSRVASVTAALGRAHKHTASYWLEAVEAGDGLRQTSEFQRALPAIRALSDEAAADRLLTAHTAAAAVDTATLAAAGLRGAEFGQALRESRLQAVSAALGVCTA